MVGEVVSDLPVDSCVMGYNTEDAAGRVKCSLELAVGSQTPP